MITLTPSEVAEHFRQAAFGMMFAVERDVRIAMESAAQSARDSIGEEKPEWDPLAPSTIDQKQRLGYFGQVSATDPLLRTGALRDSIEAETESVAGGVIGIVGSTSRVMLYQECGTTRIPPRPVIAPAMIAAQAVLEPALSDLLERACTPGERL